MSFLSQALRRGLIASAAVAGLASGAFGANGGFSNFKDETYGQLVRSAASELDPAKRKQLYSEINDLILDQSFTMTLSSLVQTFVWLPKVHGIATTTSGYPRLARSGSARKR